MASLASKSNIQEVSFHQRIRHNAALRERCIWRHQQPCSLVSRLRRLFCQTLWSNLMGPQWLFSQSRLLYWSKNDRYLHRIVMRQVICRLLRDNFRSLIHVNWYIFTAECSLGLKIQFAFFELIYTIKSVYLNELAIQKIPPVISYQVLQLTLGTLPSMYLFTKIICNIV